MINPLSESEPNGCGSSAAAAAPSLCVRVLLALIGAGLVAVIGLAAWLQPDGRGFGTHEQLGLPPCSFKAVMGLPCPHCGMTTSFAHIVRGQVGKAWDANPLGLPLFAAVLGAVLWCLWTAVTGRYLGTTEPFRWFILGTMLYLALAVVSWALRFFL